MLGDWMKNFDPPIPAMLQAGVRVMIYAGAEDFICNWVGNPTVGRLSALVW